MNAKNKVVFAIYPNANGFGYVYMENARKLLDYGAVRINPISNRKVLERIKRTLEYFRPSIVILLDPEGKSSRTGNRVKELIKKIVVHAAEINLPVMQYTRDQIKDVFEQFGMTTKYDISQILLKEFKELETKSPKERKLWTSEDRNMVIFDALSLATTWFYVNE
jgi:Holliday junction resolvasome RuvABC endonuclease subunit